MSSEKPPRRRLGAARVVVLVLCSLLFVTGTGLLVLAILSPGTAEKVVGSSKVAVEKAIAEAWTAITPDAPDAPEWFSTVRLGPLGGDHELDWCNGEFIEMRSYRISGVPPVYAAHNNCGGDVILGWDVGQHVKIEGSDVVYEVVEERHTPKWTMVSSLRGMKGELALQTCYYGEDRMRFLSLSPVVAPTPEPSPAA